MTETCPPKRDELTAWRNYLPESFVKCSDAIWQSGNVLYNYTFFDKITKPETLDRLRSKWNRTIQTLNSTGTTSEVIGHLIHHQMTQETMNELILKGKKSGKTNEIRLMVSTAELQGLVTKVISEKEIYEQDKVVKYFNLDTSNLNDILQEYDWKSGKNEINIFKNSSNVTLLDKQENPIDKIFGESENGINIKIYNIENQHFIRLRQMYNTKLFQEPYFDINLLDMENVRIHEHEANALIQEHTITIPVRDQGDMNRIVNIIVNKIVPNPELKK